MSCECYLLDTILMQAYAASRTACCEMPHWRKCLGTGSHSIRTAGREAASRGQAAQVGRRAWDSLNTSATLVTNNGRGQHTSRIWMQRALEHGLDAARLHHATGIHHGDSVRNLCDYPEVMGDENHPHTQFFLQLP